MSELRCPKCGAALTELVRGAMRAYFLFTCGTKYGRQGGLSAIRQSERCADSRSRKPLPTSATALDNHNFAGRNYA
jgi:hypothetical protein